jgi:phytanoyl-CoA hydroxylase
MKNLYRSVKYKSLLRDYKKNGWVIIKNFLDKKDALNKKKEILNFLKKNHNKFNGRYINYLNKKKNFSKITSFHQLEKIKKIKYLSTSGQINKLAKFFLFNKKPELRASELFVKPPKSKHATPIHQDAPYWNVKGNKGLTIWIALSNSKKINGSVFYFNKSHKKGIFEHSPSYVKGSSQKVSEQRLLKKYQKVITKLNPGDVLVHHCLTVHGSYTNKSNEKRIGWTFAFKQKSAPYDLKKSKNFEKSLFGQIKKREKDYIFQSRI